MGGGIAACAVAIFLAACSNPEFDGRTDTVYSLSTPSVNAKAYPGVNIVSWKPVSGAQSYNICVYEEGTFKRFDSVTACYFTDSKDLVNGKNYKYTVEAVGKNELPAREVFVTNSGLGEASAKAIVPPAGTSALELASYENGYDANADKKMALSADDITVRQYKDSVYVSFPAKAYLKYGVGYYSVDLPNEINTFAWKESVGDVAFNDATSTVNFPIMSKGKYQIAVKVRALDYYDGYNSDAYWDSENQEWKSDWISKPVVTNYEEEVVAAKTLFEVASLGLDSETKNVTAEYVSEGNLYASASKKDVRVSFIPAEKDGKPVPTSWYTVYRQTNGEYATTKVDGTVDATAPDGKYYLIDKGITDSSKSYTYYVVVSNDGKYGDLKSDELSADAKDSIPSGVYQSSIADDYKSVTWTIYAPSAAKKVAAYYLLVKDEIEPLNDQIIKNGTAATIEGSTFKTPVTANSGTVYVVVKLTQDGYKDTYVRGEFDTSNLPTE